MGQQSHKRKPWMCGACKKGFDSEDAATRHAMDAHPNASGIGIYKRHKKVDGRDYEPSFAQRAVDAELAIAMGEHTDDAWLLGE